MRFLKAGFFMVLLVCMVYSAGCAHSTTTKAVPTSLSVTTIITPPAVTTLPTTPPPQTPTISPACADMAATATDDSKFLTSLNDFNIVGQISDFASKGCDQNASLQIDQLLKKIPKPRDPTLVRARTYLLVATSYCQSPTSASPGRVADELTTFTATFKEFQDSGSQCRNTIPTIVSQSESGSQKTNFYGTGSDQEQFTLSGNTMRKFAMMYSGEDNFIVEVKDSQFNVVDNLVDETGSYMGKKSVSLGQGTYYLRVTATGPWAVILTSQ